MQLGECGERSTRLGQARFPQSPVHWLRVVSQRLDHTKWVRRLLLFKREWREKLFPPIQRHPMHDSIINAIDNDHPTPGTSDANELRGQRRKLWHRYLHLHMHDADRTEHLLPTDHALTSCSLHAGRRGGSKLERAPPPPTWLLDCLQAWRSPLGCESGAATW